MREQGLPQPGAQISEFELGEPIGTGGFGAVYRAFQPRLNREVAVKVLFPSAAQNIDRLAKRFLREIDLARRLEHPNIVRLYDYGESPDGLLWMAMELVRGEELVDVLKREGRMDPRRARRIMLQVLSALSEAHELNIVHRDLKPGNIMLTSKGADRDVVKLLDFGIGKAFGEQENSALQDLTVDENAIFGTPRYMAPELLMREHEGAHCDVYAAGLILYEMLEGRPAVEGDSTFQILAKQMKESVLFSDLLARSAFAPVIARATRKDWRERFPSALEFHAALDSVDVTARLDQPLNLDSSPMLARIDTARTPALGISAHDLGAITGDLLDGMLGEDEVMEVTVVEDDGSETLESIGSGEVARLSMPRAAAVTLDDAPSPRRSLAPLLAGLAVMLVLGGIGIAVVASGGEDEVTATAAADEVAGSASSAVDEPPAAAAAPAPVDPTVPATPEPVTVVEPAPLPDTYDWRLSSEPAGASVHLGDEVLCELTPCEVALARSEAPLELRFALEGHAGIVETVVPSEAGALKIVLQKAAPAARTDAKRSEAARERRRKKKDEDNADAGKNPFEMRAD